MAIKRVLRRFFRLWVPWVPLPLISRLLPPSYGVLFWSARFRIAAPVICPTLRFVHLIDLPSCRSRVNMKAQ